jgi:REP element-mobilizing transposase RayT
MRAEPFHLDQPRRDVVLAAIQETCIVRGWWLPAAHIRSTHIHAIVATKDKPERVPIDLKSYASRGLVKAGLETSARPKWARHGSTRWLWEEDELYRAIDYVLNGQGPDMQVHQGPEPWK